MNAKNAAPWAVPLYLNIKELLLIFFPHPKFLNKFNKKGKFKEVNRFRS